MITIPVQFSDRITHIDHAIFTAGGILSIQGWLATNDSKAFPRIETHLGGTKLKSFEVYHKYRPDVSELLNQKNEYLGFHFDYLVKESFSNKLLELVLDGNVIWSKTISQSICTPDYDKIYKSERVLHRSDIYGGGLPTQVVAPEVEALLSSELRPNDEVLDFGAGTGDTVALLLSKGLSATGLELDCVNKNYINKEAEPHLKLYDGSLPLPFENDQFDCVTSFEVMEHIPNFEACIAEIARISKRMFILTVPDANGIVRAHAQNVAPWHLLEGTHVNFFTQKNLAPILAKHWQHLDFRKITFNHLPDTFYANSLACVCTK